MANDVCSQLRTSDVSPARGTASTGVLDYIVFAGPHECLCGPFAIAAISVSGRVWGTPDIHSNLSARGLRPESPQLAYFAAVCLSIPKALAMA